MFRLVLSKVELSGLAKLFASFPFLLTAGVTADGLAENADGGIPLGEKKFVLMDRFVDYG